MQSEVLELGSWRLLEPVQRLPQQADIIRPRRIDEAGRLVTIDLLRQITVEEGVLDIELVHRPLTLVLISYMATNFAI